MEQKSNQYVLIKSFPIKEILGFVMLFAGLFIFLFPQGELEKRIFQEENSNLDLSIVYLKNISKIYKTPEIVGALAIRYAMKGDYSKAYETINESKKFFSYDKKNLLIAEYTILKNMYFSNQEQKKEIIEKIERLLENLVSTTKDSDDLFWAIKESKTLGRYAFVKYLIQKYMYLCNDDTECDSFILKSALATGDSEFASQIAIKIAKKRGIINVDSNF